MATFSKFDQFVEDLAIGVHDLATHQLTIALTNAANAPIASNSVLANLTPVSYANLSTLAMTTTSCTQTAGLLKLLIVDHVLTASGAVAPFKYIVLYNDGTTVKVNPLIGFYSYGSDLTLATGETLTINFDGSGGVLTIQ